MASSRSFSHFLIKTFLNSRPIAIATGHATAFPICLCIYVLRSVNVERAWCSSTHRHDVIIFCIEHKLVGEALRACKFAHRENAFALHDSQSLASRITVKSMTYIRVKNAALLCGWVNFGDGSLKPTVLVDSSIKTYIP